MSVLERCLSQRELGYSKIINKRPGPNLVSVLERYPSQREFGYSKIFNKRPGPNLVSVLERCPLRGSEISNE